LETKRSHGLPPSRLNNLGVEILEIRESKNRHVAVFALVTPASRCPRLGSQEIEIMNGGADLNGNFYRQLRRFAYAHE